MKTFKVKPAEKFALEFTDKKKIYMCFNTRALSYLGEEINNRKIKLAGPDFISAILYAGAKVCNPDFTVEEANALYVQLEESSPEALNGIINEYCIASGVDTEALKKNLILKMV